MYVRFLQMLFKLQDARMVSCKPSPPLAPGFVRRPFDWIIEGHNALNDVTKGIATILYTAARHWHRAEPVRGAGIQVAAVSLSR